MSKHINQNQNIDIKKNIKPKRFFDELAEYGYLLEFLKTRLAEKFYNNLEFRDEMLEILYKYSQTPIPEIDVIYLEYLIQNLEYFLEYTKPWRIARQ